MLRRSAAKAAALGVVLLQCACALPTQQSVVFPEGKFNLYNCDQLAGAKKSGEARIKDLQRLSAAAGPGTAGSIVSALSYQPDIYAQQADLAEIGRAQAAKQCPAEAGKS